jgi:DNA-directed RNA polymerase subunit E'/Rpb7
MNLKVISSDRKTIRKEFKKYNVKDNGVILVLEKNKNSKITFILDEMNKIFPSKNTEYYFEINEEIDIENINNLISNGKTIVTKIRLTNELDLVSKLKTMNKKEYLKFLNNTKVILN